MGRKANKEWVSLRQILSPSSQRLAPSGPYFDMILLMENVDIILVNKVTTIKQH